MKSLKILLLLILVMLSGIAITAVVHELAHVLAAYLLGIEVLKFSLFDLRYLSPSLTFGPVNNRPAMLVVFFSGGFLAGTMWLIFLLLYVYRKYSERNLFVWCVGLITATLASWQLVQGFIEALIHDTYITGAGKLGSASFLVQTLSIFLGFLIYLRQTTFWRKVFTKNSSEK